MTDSQFSEKQLTEMCEDCFVSVKEACMKLQEKTKCPNDVIVEMLLNVVEFYKSQE